VRGTKIFSYFPSFVVGWDADLKFSRQNVVVDYFICKTGDMQAFCDVKHISYLYIL
jgi:hypothetical protein